MNVIFPLRSSTIPSNRLPSRIRFSRSNGRHRILTQYQATQLAIVFAEADVEVVEGFIERVLEEHIFLQQSDGMTLSDLRQWLSTWAAGASVATAEEFDR